MMPEVIPRNIQWTPRATLSEIVREVNLALRQIAQDTTTNFRDSYPQIDANIIVNATLILWLPLDEYVIETIAVKTSSGTASVTPRIGGVNMGVSGGVPITATTTATQYAVTSANEASALDTVDAVVSGLAGGANLVVSLGVRRNQ